MEYFTEQFIRGIGSVIDIYPAQEGKYMVQSYAEQQNDAERLNADWERVGRTLTHLIAKELENENKKHE